jgi:hypothetical protein
VYMDNAMEWGAEGACRGSGRVWTGRAIGGTMGP